MEIKDLQGKLVAVLGYGMEGRAVATYLIKHGIKPTLFDEKPWEQWTPEEQNEIKKLEINFIFGPDWLKELKGFDVAFRSPGIQLVAVSGQLSAVSIITSQTKFFFENCPAKIIGITGTKGKGTTSALIYEMLIADSRLATRKSKTFLTGNIGKIQPLDFLDDLKDGDRVVYELSSFQLQDLDRSPHIAVVAMTTSEHLDYHADEKEYLEAKTSIVKFQAEDDFAVINADYPNSVKIGEKSPGTKMYFSRKKKIEGGCYVEGENIVIDGLDFRLPISTIQLRGPHNVENVCGAIMAAHLAGVRYNAIKMAAAGFKGLEHRLEFVAEKNRVKFYNDSFSTIPETAIAAINSFTEPLILILGGSSKNSDFTELYKTINNTKNIKTIILIGEEAGKIKKSIKSKAKLLEGAENMADIFSQIKSVAEKGDVVLLSPACASFGMFKNYKDRGGQFKSAALNF